MINNRGATIPMLIRPNPSFSPEPLASSTAPSPGLPVQVDITVPDDLVQMAETYPSIDWNNVMCHAIAERKTRK